MLHCTYTRDQLLVALDFLKSATVREGVKWLPEKQLDVFFVTLNKADKDYSPTTPCTRTIPSTRACSTGRARAPPPKTLPKENIMKVVRVVAAVICDDIQTKHKIYATARGYGEYKGGWEFPGGKIGSSSLVLFLKSSIPLETTQSLLLKHTLYKFR